MKILCGLFLFFWVPHGQIEGVYHREIQFCSVDFATDFKWSLTLNQNRTFLLEMSKNKSGFPMQHPTTTLILGAWRFDQDKLTLTRWKNEDSLLIFYKLGNKLVFQWSQSKFKPTLTPLDYLEKPSD